VRPTDRVSLLSESSGPNRAWRFVCRMGNHFEAMVAISRRLARNPPAQGLEGTHRLRSQMPGYLLERRNARRVDDHRSSILGRSRLHVFWVTDLLRSFGVSPTRRLAYRLERGTTALSRRCWTERDEMFRRFDASSCYGPIYSRSF